MPDASRHRRRGVLVALCVLLSACADGAGPLAPSANQPVSLATMDEVCEPHPDPTALEAELRRLREEVDALAAEGRLGEGPAQALRAHADNALRHLAEGNPCAVRAQLRAFRAQVEAFANAGILPDEAADTLTERADRLIDPPAIVNPSFELDGYFQSATPGDITGWTLVGFTDDHSVNDFGVSSTGPGTPYYIIPIPFATDGLLGVHLFTKTAPNSTRRFEAGQVGGLRQVVNLTGVDAIGFDAWLARSWDDRPFAARVLVDGVVRWSQNAPAYHAEQRLDVSGLTGWHVLEFRIEALEAVEISGAGDSRWFLLDNVQLLPATP